MPVFIGGQPAPVAHAALKETLVDLSHVEQHATLWFADILRRRLYREFGYSSIQAYASEALGFSASKTSQFIRLAESLQNLPGLRQSIARGEIPWTKAREVAKVATRKSERRWIAKATKVSCRELEAAVRQTRDSARRLASLSDPARDGQGDLPLDEAPQASAISPGNPALEIAELVQVASLRFRPVERARFEALLEKLQKRARRAGRRAESRETLVLAGLASLLAAEGRGQAIAASRPNMASSLNTACSPNKRSDLGDRAGENEGLGSSQSSACKMVRSVEEFTRVNSRGGGAREADLIGSERGLPRDSIRAGAASPYQIVILRDESQRTSSLLIGRRKIALSEASFQRIACDARILEPGKRNRSLIPPALRRQVLARDGYRCQVPGCGSARFLEVHHRLPRSSGGGNEAENLITLCSACHQMLHEQGLAGGDHAAALLRPSSP